MTATTITLPAVALLVTVAALPAAAQSVISGAGGSISTDKNGNVRIAGDNGQSITKSGARATITDASGRASTGSRRAAGSGRGVTISGNGVHRTYACGGGPVTVSGNDNVLTLRGTCASITATGNRNTFIADTAAAISTPGNGNRVQFATGSSGAAPSVSNTGTGNTIARRQ